MSEQYNGISQTTLSNLPGAVAIASSSSLGSTQQIVTATPHGMTTGDKATIFGHNVLTCNAPGWNVTVTSVNSFTIPLSGGGTGAALGSVQPLAFGPTFQIPTDGDAFDAGAWNVACEALGDRTAALAYLAGAIKTIADYNFSRAGSGFFDQWSTTTVTGSSTTYIITDTAAWTIDNIGPSDRISVEAGFSFGTGPIGVAGALRLDLQYAITPPGGSMSAWSPVTGTERWMSSGDTFASVQCNGYLQNTGVGRYTFAIGLQGVGTFPYTVHAIDSYTVRIVQYRDTVMPQ